ncbi:hypothetical protein ACFX13_038741 [Malus domestica]
MSFLVHICGMELTEKAEALHLHTLERGGQPNYKTWEILMEGRLTSQNINKAIEVMEKGLVVAKIVIGDYRTIL